MWRKLTTATAILMLFADPAMAYIGPGIGVGMIATVLGILTAIVLAIFAVFGYPIKRLLRRNSRQKIKTTVNPSGQ
jgi:threonine/homoserine/homoserine lactone efflux protein